MTGRSLDAARSSAHASCSCGDPPGRLKRDDGVEQQHAHTGQHDVAVAALVGLPAVAVVVAPHGVEALAERATVELPEGCVLLVVTVGSEVSLDDHRRGVDRGDLGDRAGVHHLGIRRFARLGAKHGLGPERLVDAAHFFAEMNVVHGREAAQQLAARPRQGAHLDAHQRVLRVRREPVEPMHLGALVEHDFVVGDRRELERHHGSSRPATTGGLGARRPDAPTSDPRSATPGRFIDDGARRRRGSRPGHLDRGDDRCHLLLGRRRVDVADLRCRRGRCHSGMFPCLRRGSSSRLVRSMRRPAMSLTLVSAGSMTSST